MKSQSKKPTKTRKGKTTTQQAVQNTRAVQEAIDREVTKAARAANRVNHEAVPKAPKGGVYNLPPALDEYLKQMSSPMNHAGAKNPAPENPAPTIRSFTTSTVYEDNFSIGVGESRHIFLYPGHGIHDDDIPMDGESYHSRSMIIGGDLIANAYTIGPVATVNLAGGTASARCTVGWISPSQAYSSLGALPYSNVTGSAALAEVGKIPFAAQVGNGGHTRWMLNGMEIQIYNTTTGSSRGGLINYGQPISNGGITSYEALKLLPGYKETGRANTDDGLSIVWSSRANDRAFWHQEDDGLAQNNGTTAAIIIMIRGTSAIQNYRYFVKCHWEISGTSVSPFMSPSVVMPAANDVIGPASAAVANHEASGNGLHRVASLMHTAMMAGLHGVQKAGPEVIERAARSLGGPLAEHMVHTVRSLMGPGVPVPRYRIRQ